MELYLTKTGKGRRVSRPLNSYWTAAVRWESRETHPDGTPVQVREPKQKEKQMDIYDFTAGGVRYSGLDQLTFRPHPQAPTVRLRYGYSLFSDTYIQSEHWFLDTMGRTVFCVTEGFPCFDSEDYASETRCYRWFYIRTETGLTCVYSTDGDNRIFVTEDVSEIAERSWLDMENEGFFTKTVTGRKP